MDYEIKPGLYRHFKGKQYRVLLVAVHSETLEPMVVYQALYGEQGMWVRPVCMWNEMVQNPAGAPGELCRRFTYIGE